jgi:branched-chain amino acid transport system ATP-binding protein
MIAFEGVDVHYAKKQVLRGICLGVHPGEAVALIGPNAAGKTTTLRTAAGLKAVTAGSVRFADEDVTHLPTHERVRRGLVLVPEGRQIFPKFSVLENLRMGAYHRRDRNNLADDLERVFAIFPKLAQRRGQRAGVMSGGEQQMVAIARGLMSRPRCLLLDEPTLGLAPIVADEIAATVHRLVADGMAVVIAEQNAAVALACSCRAYVLESGAISLRGPSDELRRTDAVRALYLGERECTAAAISPQRSGTA